jgi:hypothetical protein
MRDWIYQSTRELGAHDEVIVESAVVLSLGGPTSGLRGLGGVVSFDRTFPRRKISRKVGAADLVAFLYGEATGDAKLERDGLEWAGGKK